MMHYPFVKDLLDYKVFLSVEPELQLKRRLSRDMNERNYTEAQILYQWKNHVLPSFHNFILPHKDASDLVITNNESFDENIHTLTSVIAKKTGINR
ncbi:MAG: hypothetical protein IPM74_19435 [Crocinitomicaceae bacterium]|nr:hypothetical protein [Crocinitomicaceae bacterium]